MPALNFTKQFVQKVESGIKIHSIRAWKRPFKIGDKLYLYYAQKTKYCRKLSEEKAVYVKDICIREIKEGLYEDLLIRIDGIILTYDLRIKLATNDGFDSYEDFKDYFIKEGLPFIGQIIGWVEGIDYAR